MKAKEVTFTHKKVVNIYIVCDIDYIDLWLYTQGFDFTFKSSFFGAVKLTILWIFINVNIQARALVEYFYYQIVVNLVKIM